jgi:hypothetical protein
VQQSANRLTPPVARLGQLSVEAAKQHRLAVEADYFPKFGATFANLHYSEFLGQLVTVRRPIAGGSLIQVPVPIFSQNMTIANVTLTQPITPLFEVRQAVRIARADERIAMAKAAIPVTKNARDTELEETYFKLLIAQRRLLCVGSTQRASEGRPRYAGASIQMARAEVQESQAVEAGQTCENTAAEAKELTASLNRAMGWPDDTELELAKAAADVKKSYLELQRSRQLTKVALRMGSSMAVVMRASTSPDSSEVKVARAEIEVEMLEADLAHRQAFNRLMALADPRR